MQLQAEGSFNSMKVRLKLIEISQKLLLFMSFNSMKVRLKRVHRISPKNTYMFQFHEGPIKTPIIQQRKNGRKTFQFHEGPIKTIFGIMNASFILSFNSMKVRLKHRTDEF